jgi:ribosomal protein S12
MIAVRALEQSGVEKAAPNHAFRKFARTNGKNARPVQAFSTLTHRKCT